MAAAPVPIRGSRAARAEAGKVYYLSPRCPDLRARVWLQFLGLPRHLWSEHGVNAAIAEYGAVAHFDAASFRRAGRMVVEARVTEWRRLPRRLMVNELQLHAGAAPPRHPVRLLILSYEPVEEEKDGGGHRNKSPMHVGTSSSRGLCCYEVQGDIDARRSSVPRLMMDAIRRDY